jgi:beta-aspartyl-peptidase (threonine type)
MLRFGIVAHGGVGASRDLDDGCEAAAEAGFRVLERGGSALEAVVAAAVVLEDDPRYNAGTGSVIRLDGKTIEMDASLMTSEGAIGAVAAIQFVKNPILVARDLLATPHMILSGEGAVRFARLRGHPHHYDPPAKSIERHRQVVRMLKERNMDGFRPNWREADVRALWNFQAEFAEVFGSDTIGAAAVDESGLFAVANSTGGATPMLLGRVGDTPILGAGFYAGPGGAVATTGIGEEIIRRQAARAVYDRIVQGETPQTACERVTAAFPREVLFGAIAISRRGVGIADNRQMAQARRVGQ